MFFVSVLANIAIQKLNNMKKYIVILFMFYGFLATHAQQNYKVGVEPEKKNILLESFTGTTCGFCPEGHRIANTIAKIFNGEAYVLNIHAGTLAGASKGVDFKTEEGDALSDYFKSELAGYPCAMINRHLFKNSYLFSRTFWLDLSKELHEESAPLNLYTESEYDDKTKELKVHVEGYNTEDNSGKDLKINVLISQDYIKGNQAGSATPNSYIHMHILRDYITPLEGDKVNEKSKGDYFSKDYIYIMPDSIKNVQLKPEDINVIAFVTSDNITEVLNVTGGKPIFKNFSREPSGDLYEPNIPVGARYGYNFFEAFIKNNSTERVTKATFEVTTNGVTQTQVVDCDVPPFETGYVKVPCNYDYDEKGIVKYVLKLTELNDNVIEPKFKKGQFTHPSYTDGTVYISISTDASAAENKFYLKDEDGNILKTFGPYEDNACLSYEEEIYLDEEKTYCFEILDEDGDGMLDCANGSLTTRAGTGKLIDQFYKITYFGVRSFFTVDKKLSIDDIKLNISDNGHIYSLDGRQLDADSSEKLIIKNGKKQLNINN